MFRVLLKKQLYEVFKSWFYNPKTGQARSLASTVSVIVLFVLLVVGLIGGMAGSIAFATCEAMAEAGVQWLYFDLFAMLALVLGLFGSVLNTYSELYLSKDNDLLLSMPIPVGTIVASRVFVTYLMGTIYSALVFLPAVVVYQIVGGFDPSALAGSILLMLELSLLVWLLSCLLGFVVAKLSQRLKNRSFVKVLASLVFIGLYYFVYFKAQMLIMDLVSNAALYGSKIKGSAYLVYLWGQTGAGNLPAGLIGLAVCLALAALTWLVLSRTFLGIATAAPQEKKAAAVRKDQNVKSPAGALLAKEFSRYASSAGYMLNCSFGTLFLPAAGIAVLIKGAEVVAMLPQELQHYIAAIPVILAALACMMASMNDSAAPSVSLEGKSLWLLQSLPIDPWQAIWAKIKVQLLLTEIPMAFLCLCIAIALPLSALETAMCIVLCLLYPVLQAFFDMFIGLKMPNLTWTNEIVPIKQSGSVAIALFGGWGYAVLLAGGYFLLAWKLGTIDPALYLAVFSLLTAAASAALFRWLKTRGADLLRTL